LEFNRLAINGKLSFARSRAVVRNRFGLLMCVDSAAAAPHWFHYQFAIVELEIETAKNALGCCVLASNRFVDGSSGSMRLSLTAKCGNGAVTIPIQLLRVRARKSSRLRQLCNKSFTYFIFSRFIIIVAWSLLVNNRSSHKGHSSSSSPLIFLIKLKVLLLFIAEQLAIVLILMGFIKREWADVCAAVRTDDWFKLCRERKAVECGLRNEYFSVKPFIPA
jgi:hypothetical protein